MYSERPQGTDTRLQQSFWWSARDRWIPPQQLHWTRPLLARLRLARRQSFSPSPWLRIS